MTPASMLVADPAEYRTVTTTMDDAGKNRAEDNETERHTDAPRPEGWYPDPDIPRSVRRWDGTAWTEQHRFLPARDDTTPTRSMGPSRRLAFGLGACLTLLVTAFLAADWAASRPDTIYETPPRNPGAEHAAVTDRVDELATRISLRVTELAADRTADDPRLLEEALAELPDIEATTPDMRPVGSGGPAGPGDGQQVQTSTTLVAPNSVLVVGVADATRCQTQLTVTGGRVERGPTSCAN